MEISDILKDCVVEEGWVVKLPNIQLDRKTYLDVKKKLELIGGKWKSGKTQGFIFNEDPTDLLEEISNGGNRNLKKEYQFFATPDNIADWLVELANINEGDKILEPSAGQGAIVDAILRSNANFKSVDLIEAMSTNQKILIKKYDHINKVHIASPEGDDFLNFNDSTYDKIIANPPFSKNQDIDHVNHMYNCLKVGGRLVSVMSKHWQISNNRKENEFRGWLENVNAEIINIEAGAFKVSGTMIGTTIVIINKYYEVYGI